MKILDNIEIHHLTLLIDDVLVIGDVHIGYEEALNKQGILIPRFHFKDLIQQTEKILKEIKSKKIGKKKFKLKTIVLLGDLKHEFGTISDQEWRETLKFLDLLSKHCKKIILLKGNHDTVLGPIAKKRNLEVVEDYKHKDILFLHGHKKVKIPKEINTIIIGHEHPAVTVREGLRHETFKCFLLGEYEKKNLIVVPSFNPLIEGSDIMNERLLSPLLSDGIEDFEAFVIADEVYDFGKVKNLE